MDYYYISQLGIEQKHSLCWHFQSTVVNAEFIQTIASWFWILQLTRSFHWWTIPSIDYIFISVEYCNPELKKTTTLWFQVQLTRTWIYVVPKKPMSPGLHYVKKPLYFWDFIMLRSLYAFGTSSYAKKIPCFWGFNMPRGLHISRTSICHETPRAFGTLSNV